MVGIRKIKMSNKDCFQVIISFSCRQFEKGYMKLLRTRALELRITHWVVLNPSVASANSLFITRCGFHSNERTSETPGAGKCNEDTSIRSLNIFSPLFTYPSLQFIILHTTHTLMTPMFISLSWTSCLSLDSASCLLAIHTLGVQKAFQLSRVHSWILVFSMELILPFL